MNERVAKERQAAAKRLRVVLTDAVLNAASVAAYACTEGRPAPNNFVLWCHEQVGRVASTLRPRDAAKRVPVLLKVDVLEAMTVAAVACDEDQAAAIAFVLWCYKAVGKRAPDFGRFFDECRRAAD